MRYLFYFLLFLIILWGIAACSPDSNDPVTDGSTLIVQSDTLRLTAIDSSKSLDLMLSCGCGFTVRVASSEGDTAYIKCQPNDDMMTRQSMHSVRFTCSPSTFLMQRKSAKFHFLASKSTYTYTNSVVVIIE